MSPLLQKLSGILIACSCLVSVCFAGGRFVRVAATDHSKDDSFTPQQIENFENNVRPILARRCNECHAAGEAEGGLSLQSRKSMILGGDTGAAIIPGDPKNSLLVQALHYDDVYQMPPDSKLPDEEIKIIEDWIRDSAPWPQHSDEEIAVAASSFDIEGRVKEHWCWQPVVAPDLPAGTNGSKAIDWLVEKRLTENGLVANGSAKRTSLLRRISFDLTGLPPSQELVQQFSIDESVSKEQVIDQLLDSPHFGERWARHWMDLSRYAETYGHEFDYPINDAWQYRDYLIRAFNEDVPYDQFVTEHLAGDLIENPRRNPDSDFNESVLATGFWFLGEAVHGPVDSKEDEAKRIDNQIDVMCRSFVGLTVACARCHDHKFDAISTKDYYALSGFLQSSRRQRTVIDENREFEEAVQEVFQIRKKFSDSRNELHSSLSKTFVREFFLKGDPGYGNKRKLVKQKLEIALRKEIPEFEFIGKKPQLPEGQIEFPLDDSNWKATGFAFHRADSGSAIIDQNISWLPHDSISSASNGLPFAGTAHSSTFDINKKFIHVRIKAKNALVQLVVDGFRMHEFNAILFKGLIHKDVNHESFEWLTIGHELYLHEGNRAWLEFQDFGEGFFAVDRVVFSDDPKPPSQSAAQLELTEKLKEMVDGDDFDGLESLKLIFNSEVDVRTESFLAWVLRRDLGIAFKAEKPCRKIKALVKKIHSITSRLPQPKTALAIMDGFPEDEHVFIRGNHKTLGDIVPRRFLSALGGTEGDPHVRKYFSGRLRLAEEITEPSNPLTSRVIVNRVWHHLFGRGIVRSVDNFGVLGEKPSHPELLDHLADEFVKDGWSIKRLIRKLMLTDAYARSSSPSAEGARKDPDNVFLSRANVRRLQGEAIRDAMLAASGRLNRKMFGPSEPVHITPFMNGRGLPKRKGKLDSDGRRSIYIETRRNFLSSMMLAFDTPIPFNAIGMRTVSNVPAQALILMNDPLVAQQSKKFAQRVVARPGTIDQRVEFVYLTALSRKPDAKELQKAKAFIESHASRLKLDVDSEKVWADFCHVVFNVKEFIWLN